MKERFPQSDGWYARFFCAFSFLTRLRLPFANRIAFTPAVLADSMVWYPVVGCFYSLVSLGLWWLGTAIKLDLAIIAFAIFAAPYLINRFLHFDGLCDTLDAFLVDRTAEQRLEIMKDSRNGSYATGGGALVLLGKYLLIRSLLDSSVLSLVVVVPIVLRWLVILMAWRAAYPRPAGTGFHLVGQVEGWRLGLSTVVMILCATPTLAAGFITISWDVVDAPGLIPFVASLGCAAAWTVWLRLVSQRKIRGVTGDVLGCLVESGEAIFLLGGLLAIQLLDLRPLAS